MISVESRSVNPLQNPDAIVGMKAKGVNMLRIYHTPYVDTSGIPLSSDRRYPKLLTDIDFEYQACPYSGSPSRYPSGEPNQIPMSGLERRRLGENYTEMQAVMGGLRGLYKRMLSGEGHTTADPMTVAEMQQFLRALIFLPHYLVHRGANPLPAKGALLPSVVGLSNSSAGVLAALESYIHFNQKDQNIESKIPDPSEMVEAAERLGHMVGPKTVCAASPALMRHFIGAIVYGTDKGAGNSDRPVIDEAKAGSFFSFGPLAYLAHEEIGALSVLDSQAFWRIEVDVKNGASRQHIKEEIRGFRLKTQPVLATLHLREAQLNGFLGRYPRSEKLTIESLDLAGFKMPALMRKFYSK